MPTTDIRDRRRLDAARAILGHLAGKIDTPFSVELWDGSLVALGPSADGRYRIVIDSAGTLGSLLRRPRLETLAQLYAAGRIDFQGADLIAMFEAARASKVRLKMRDLRAGALLRQALPLLTARARSAPPSHRFAGDEIGHDQSRRDEKAFIQFHYDAGNDFYALFLDPEMLYSCGYFTDWTNGLAQAQHDKLDMICRKLRLQPGERFLDIGCGWGGLLCHAATHYKVQAHGVTLSQAQADFARAKVERLGLADRVRIELRSYEELEGEWDKIASIGMYEHVGIANYPTYFGKLNRLLRDRGLLLNHGITRRAKANRRKFRRIRPENRLIRKYIFPGSELDHIGHSLESMEAQGFEIHDVEGWREHYAMTLRHWHGRLAENEAAAVALVGREKYRMWIAYLAGVTVGFQDGSLRIYQTLASKHRAKGGQGLPPTRADLYR
ncbi:MAG: class I SAM-dependent methyltransferase [Sneathiellaceae bacterium]